MVYKNKNCIICKNEYTPTNSRQKYCPECRKLGKYLYDKEWVNKNKDKRKIVDHNYYIKNKDKIKNSHKKWVNNNKEHLKEYNKKWEYNNKTKRNKYKQNKRKNDINFKVSCWARSQINRCLFFKNTKYEKNKHSFDILGYTPEQIKTRIEFQFKKGMNWDNYGKLWEIDHKKPLKMFRFINEKGVIDYKQIRIANGLSNLQPMLIHDNRVKSGNFIL